MFGGLPLVVNTLITLGSLIVLVGSADYAISRAILVARRYRVSPLIIGTTLVAISTSLAELVVNLAATFSGAPTSIVIGNVLGSNMANIGVGLGIAAIITPLRTATLVIEREFVLYFAVTALMTGLALSGAVNRYEGGILVVCFVIVLYLIYQYARRGQAEVPAAVEDEGETDHVVSPILIVEVVLALVALVVAAEVLVEAVSGIARAAGVSDYIIGVTIVGIGTSLPEIATSIQAARRDQVDLVLGNVFGSNVFNICIALGLPASIRVVPVPASAVRDLYFLNSFGLVVVFILLGEYPFLGRNKVIGAWGGGLIVAVYVGYLAFKVATGA
ncbi:MAG TPA: calcium/sodium antiporter [Chloroflexota bacterium]|nr:calcium/sodium antiporter [Chloroflexota bacterium]